MDCWNHVGRQDCTTRREQSLLYVACLQSSRWYVQLVFWFSSTREAWNKKFWIVRMLIGHLLNNQTWFCRTVSWSTDVQVLPASNISVALMMARAQDQGLRNETGTVWHCHHHFTVMEYWFKLQKASDYLGELSPRIIWCVCTKKERHEMQLDAENFILCDS